MSEADDRELKEAASADAEEQRQAAAFAELTEQLVVGKGGASHGELPELLAAAGMIRAANDPPALEEGRAAQWVDDAAKDAARRRRMRASQRWAGALAIAAALLLMVGVLVSRSWGPRSPGSSKAGPGAAQVQRFSQLRPLMLSRPSDDLVGRPIRDSAGAARRIDRVFASRLSGYRAARMTGWRSE